MSFNPVGPFIYIISTMFNFFPSSGWDDLFTKCSENLNSLVAMKLSPYYKGKLIDLESSCVRTYFSILVFEEEVLLLFT